ncbi:RDD family protein [Salegentibacter chungangensis]|uniref:RDD family protein n=1 Tax=Salegentibacter chungangensis TaxID=1335724 RepID=A0ABW3NPD9_9FLAO
MDNFQIETAQNISISQNVAGVGDRILAFIIDSFIIGLYLVLAGLTMGGMGLDGGGMWVYYLVLGLPSFLYYLIWESFWSGQTPGKAALQIRVVKKDGSRPAFSNYLVRWLLRIIDISLSSGGIAVVTILLNGKGQRLGDIAAGTTVISEKHRIGLVNTLNVDIPENYDPKYPQVTMLKDKDVQNIKNLFQQARRNGNHQVIISLSQKVSELLEVNVEERPVDFLRQVISDYNYYTQR